MEPGKTRTKDVHQNVRSRLSQGCHKIRKCESKKALRKLYLMKNVVFIMLVFISCFDIEKEVNL